MNYKELKRIAEAHTDSKTKTVPLNAFDIAQWLNLRIKNSIEAKRDFAETTNPLTYSEGCLSIVNGEYVIYHNEKNAYKNFTVAHEIAHYLLHHTSDGTIQHHDANLLAVMLIAPKRLIIKSRIKTAEDLSEKCKIPIEVAQSYWTELNIKRLQKEVILCILAGLCVLASAVSAAYSFRIAKTNGDFAPITTQTAVSVNKSIPTVTHTLSSDDMVYITPSGEKYHSDDCIYIEDKDNLIEMPLSQAEDLGYEPCKVCQ